MSYPKPYPRRFAYILLGAVLTISLNSCAPGAGRISFIQARFLASRGAHSEAIALLLPLLDEPVYKGWAAYELGGIYLAMGETASAVRQFDAVLAFVAAQAGEKTGALEELAYRSRFNRALALYRERNYPDAASGFRAALELDASRIEAKRNLELALEQVVVEATRPQTRSSAQHNDTSSAGERSLVEYLRKGERERWQSTRWKGEVSRWPDY